MAVVFGFGGLYNHSSDANIYFHRGVLQRLLQFQPGGSVWQSLKEFPSVMAAVAAVADPLRRHKLVVVDVVVGDSF